MSEHLHLNCGFSAEQLRYLGQVSQVLSLVAEYMTDRIE